MVRGLKVSFSYVSVNMHFGLPEVKDEYAALLDKIYGEELNQLLQELTVEGTTWLAEAENGPLRCSRSALKLVSKFWYHIIRTRLLPTTHIETVSKDRLVLLHCILENKKISIGNLIEKEIYVCAFKPKWCLFFPSLITELCLRSGVEISSVDEMLPNTGAISTIAIKRFAQPTEKVILLEVPK